MLVNNFSAGITGGILALLVCTAIGPVVQGLNSVLKAGVESIVHAGLTPLTSVFVKRNEDAMDEGSLEDAKLAVKDIKNGGTRKLVSKIIFACDAGMGSSAMGATMLRNKF